MISVVIPTCNRPDELERCLASLSRDDVEVCVIDNSKQNRGNVAARNIGLRETSGDIVVFLDDDSEAGFALCSLVARRFEADSTLGLIAFRVLDEDVPTPFALIDPSGREVAAWTGCGGAVRRELCDGFEETGKLASAWEWELVAQVKSKGYTVKTFDDIYVRHSFSQAGAGKYRQSKQKAFEATRVPLLFWAKYGPWRELLWHGWRWSHAVAQATLEQRTGLYLHGYLSTLARLPDLWPRRRPVDPDVAKTLRPTLRFKGK